MPVAEQPVSRLQHHGAGPLSTSELLAILLGAQTMAGADHILGEAEGLVGLARMTFSELVALTAVGEATAARIKAAFELGRRLLVAGLPLIEVAEAWGIHLTTYRGREDGSYGWAIPGRAIGLGVANLSTWAHELVYRSFHLRLRNASQAEHRLGTRPWATGKTVAPAARSNSHQPGSGRFCVSAVLPAPLPRHLCVEEPDLTQVPSRDGPAWSAGVSSVAALCHAQTSGTSSAANGRPE